MNLGSSEAEEFPPSRGPREIRQLARLLLRGKLSAVIRRNRPSTHDRVYGVVAYWSSYMLFTAGDFTYRPYLERLRVT